MQNTVIFDKPYSIEKMEEGIAVNQAVISGACTLCQWLKDCESGDEGFSFPAEATCMKILKIIRESRLAKKN